VKPLNLKTLKGMCLQIYTVFIKWVQSSLLLQHEQHTLFYKKFKDRQV